MGAGVRRHDAQRGSMNVSVTLLTAQRAAAVHRDDLSRDVIRLGDEEAHRARDVARITLALERDARDDRTTCLLARVCWPHYRAGCDGVHADRRGVLALERLGEHRLPCFCRAVERIALERSV